MSWQNEIVAHLESVYTALLQNADSELEPLDEKRLKVQGMLENLQVLKQCVLAMFPTKPYDIEPPLMRTYTRYSR